MKYGELTLGQTEALVNKLGGMDGVRQFLSGETTARVVAEFVFKPFKTIKLGTFANMDEFRGAFKVNSFRIGDWANSVLEQPAFTIATEETEVDLVVVSISELGFQDRATRTQIYQRAQEFGLELCPPEVGPQLRLQYQEQPEGESLLVGIEPMDDSNGNLGVFRVEHDARGCLWLDSVGGHSDNFWYDTNRWVFVSPKLYFDIQSTES